MGSAPASLADNPFLITLLLEMQTTIFLRTEMSRKTEYVHNPCFLSANILKILGVFAENQKRNKGMEIRDNKNEDIELRREEFQEVLGEVPGWLLRWGIILVASIIALLLIGSSIFKYPEVISSSMVLTGTSPVASVVAKTSGKLQMLFIKDNQYVSKG